MNATVVNRKIVFLKDDAGWSAGRLALQPDPSLHRRRASLGHLRPFHRHGVKGRALRAEHESPLDCRATFIACFAAVRSGLKVVRAFLLSRVEGQLASTFARANPRETTLRVSAIQRDTKTGFARHERTPKRRKGANAAVCEDGIIRVWKTSCFMGTKCTPFKARSSQIAVHSHATVFRVVSCRRECGVFVSDGAAKTRRVKRGGLLGRSSTQMDCRRSVLESQ